MDQTAEGSSVPSDKTRSRDNAKRKHAETRRYPSDDHFSSMECQTALQRIEELERENEILKKERYLHLKDHESGVLLEGKNPGRFGGDRAAENGDQ